MIRRKTPLKRSGFLKRTGWPLRRVSKKYAKELRTYSKLRKEFLDSRMICEAFPIIWPEAQGFEFATEVHHKNGRGKYLNDVTTWLPVGRTAHSWIHAHPGQARELGLLQ